MLQSRSRLECINSDIERVTHSYDFNDKKAYVYCDAAAEYANAKKYFVHIHLNACKKSGTVQQRRKFWRAYEKKVERMRLMHKELIITNDRNKTLIMETDKGYENSFAELGRKFDFPKFAALFEEYAAWKEIYYNKDGESEAFDIGAAKSAIDKYKAEKIHEGYSVTRSVWIAPHMFEAYVNGGSSSVKLKTHAAFQAMIAANFPNATVSWGVGLETELRLWDSGYVFYGDHAANLKLSENTICSLSLDEKGFTLAAGDTSLPFRKLPVYANWEALRTWREVADCAAFHHSLLSQIAGDDVKVDHAIYKCGKLSRLMSKTQAADIPKDRLIELMRAFEVGLGH